MMSRAFLAVPSVILLALSSCSSSSGGTTNGGNGAACHPQAGASYPATGCGYNLGDVVDDYSWTGRLAGISSPVTTLNLHDYYNPDGSKQYRYMLITVSAFWCQACKDEAPQLAGVQTKYGPKGVFVMTDIAQKIDQSLADQGDVDAWINAYKMTTAVVTDSDFVLSAFFKPSQMPLDLIIDLKTMKIVQKAIGAALPSMTAYLDSVTG